MGFALVRFITDRPARDFLIGSGMVTLNELKRRFPNASKATIARNADADSQASGPKPQRTVRNESLAKGEGEKENPDRVRIRIVSLRRRLIDPDNLCPKYHVDCLRYAGFIRNDTADDIVLEVSQRKVESKADECTLIEVEPID